MRIFGILITLLISLCIITSCSNSKDNIILEEETVMDPEEVSSNVPEIPEDKNINNSNKTYIIPTDFEESLDFFLSELSDFKYYKENRTVGSELSMNSLEKILWVYNPQISNSMYLWFYSNGEFFIGTNYQGVWLTHGEYEIIDSETIYLSNYVGKLYVEGLEEIDGGFYLKFTHNPRNFYFEELLYVDGTNEFFGNSSTFQEEGLFELNGIEVIKKEGYYVTNDRVKFRTEPNINSDTIPVYYFIETRDSSSDTVHYIEGEKDYFAKGAKINVLARSNQKYVIDGYNNYWYYIHHSSDEYNVTGWVYGEFIEPYNEELNNQYHEIYEADVKMMFNN